jgi:hypothetical protein
MRVEVTVPSESKSPLWKLKIYWLAHSSPILVSILSQINTAYLLLYISFEINFNIKLPLTPVSSSHHFSSDFPTKTQQEFLFFPVRVAYHANPIVLDLINLIIPADNRAL